MKNGRERFLNWWAWRPHLFHALGTYWEELQGWWWERPPFDGWRDPDLPPAKPLDYSIGQRTAAFALNDMLRHAEPEMVLAEMGLIKPQSKAFRRPPPFANPVRRKTMATTNIRIEAIENGFLVSTGYFDEIPYGGRKQRFYPTLADLAVDIPDIMEKAVNEAEDHEQQRHTELAEKVKHYRECPDRDPTRSIPTDEEFMRDEPAVGLAEPLDLSEDDRA